ncbi:TlpA disulfide reductase family protein [Campylobacter sp. 19-13652]|uniref:TlpA family protein disulfide reductase n=1 Tax=Campylobacter sp. 19-13652 TaxID=2840180 RepID=UPI001C7884F8|nr:TlpA disulfide reductase family protein [Campylobacter sp. 19-13652]BCX80006.1 hypothetical protein LBC_14680 [Campylobacter sp. 19-13652]
MIKFKTTLKKSQLFIFFMLFGAMLAGCVDPLSRHHIALNDEKGIDTRFDPKQKQLKLASDEPFVLFFYDTDCGACKAQIPDIEALSHEYAGRVKFIGILGGTQGFDKDMKLLKEHNVSFITISDPVSVQYFDTAVGGVNGVPVTFIFNKNGEQAGKTLGYTPRAAINKKILSVL